MKGFEDIEINGIEDNQSKKSLNMMAIETDSNAPVGDAPAKVGGHNRSALELAKSTRRELR